MRDTFSLQPSNRVGEGASSTVTLGRFPLGWNSETIIKGKLSVKGESQSAKGGLVTLDPQNPTKSTTTFKMYGFSNEKGGSCTYPCAICPTPDNATLETIAQENLCL